MILIVEDHADTRYALVKLLTKDGHEPIGVASGEQALLFLETSQRPSLILLDFHLPGMDGLEVLTRIRADPRTADVPVVFYSAADAGAVRGRAIAAGARPYICKGSMDWLQWIAILEPYAGKLAKVAPPPPPAS